MFIFVLGEKLYVEKIVEAIIDNTIFFMVVLILYTDFY